MLHSLVGLVAAATAGILAAVIAKLREFVGPGGPSQGTRTGARSNGAASVDDLELENRRNWSRMSVAVLIVLFVLLIVVLSVWRALEPRAIIATTLVTAIGTVAGLAHHSVMKKWDESRRLSVIAIELGIVVLGSFLTIYLLLPDPPNSSRPVPTPQPSLAVETPSVSPDTVNSSGKMDSPTPAAPGDSGTIAPTPEPTVDSPVPTSSVEPSPNSDRQRKKQIEQLQADLHSKSEGTRRGAFKGAMDSDDREIRDSALSTALKSPYHDLRSSALPSAIRTSPSFVLKITDTDRKPDSVTLRDKLGREFDVQLTHFDRSANTFIASSPASAAIATAGAVPFPHNRPGAVAGEHLNFSFDVALAEPGEGCYGVARLSGTSGMLTGTMHCVGNLTANYSIEINILK